MQQQMKCEYCGRAFPPQASAPHKRFCQEKCRNNWHQKMRKQALALMAKANSAMAPEKEQTDA